MKDSPFYRFLKLGGGKINASLGSPTDTTYVQKTNHLLCNYQLRHEKGIFITVRNEWIFMINEINVLYQRSPFFYEFLCIFKVLKLAYSNELVLCLWCCA